MDLGMESKRDPERGAKLRAHRDRLGLTQRQVADRIGTVTDVISRHERGGGMEADTLMKYASLYGVSADSLAGEGGRLQPATLAHPLTDDVRDVLMRLLNDGRCNPLTENEKQHMLRHIAEGNSPEIDDLEIHLLGHRAEVFGTEEALDKFRAAVRRVRKARGQGRQGSLEPTQLSGGKRKKLVRRTELLQ